MSTVGPDFSSGITPESPQIQEDRGIQPVLDSIRIDPEERKNRVDRLEEMLEKHTEGLHSGMTISDPEENKIALEECAETIAFLLDNLDENRKQQKELEEKIIKTNQGEMMFEISLEDESGPDIDPVIVFLQDLESLKKEESEIAKKLEAEIENKDSILQHLPQAEAIAKQLELLIRVHKQDINRLKAAEKPPPAISEGKLEEIKAKVQTFFHDPFKFKLEKKVDLRSKLIHKFRESLKTQKFSLEELTQLMRDLHFTDLEVSKIKEGKDVNVHPLILGPPVDSETIFYEVSLGSEIYENRNAIRRSLMEKRIEASENENPILAEAISRVWVRLNDLENFVSLMEEQNAAIDKRAEWEKEKMIKKGDFPSSPTEKDALMQQLKSGKVNLTDVALPLILTEEEFKAVLGSLTQNS